MSQKESPAATGQDQKANSAILPHPSLSGEDIRYLSGRYWLNEEWITRAGIEKVSDQQGRDAVGKHEGKGDMSGFIIPNRHPITGQVRNNTLRRRRPELRTRTDGTTKEEAKYLREPGKNHAYFPPGTNPDHLKEPSVTRYIIEGEFKAVALARLLEESHRTGLVIGLAGVSNFSGRIGREPAPDGGFRDMKGTIPDIAELVMWKGADVVILYDYDDRTETRRNVKRAQRRLVQTLQELGATVRLATIPPDPDGKCGFDDFILREGERRALELLDAANPVEVPGYRMTEHGIIWKKPGPEGTTDKPLTNFTAVITREIRMFDDAENPLFFEIEAAFRGTVKRFVLPAVDFTRMEWHLKELGAAAAIYPDHGAKDRARFAIQLFSGDIPQETIYRQTGWAMIDGRRCYLHGRGAIGMPGVTVDLGRMTGYGLPDAKIEHWKLHDAITAALRFLDIAPRAQTWPVLAAAFLSPLSSLVRPDFVLWLHGQTGSMKSTVAALALSFQGDFSRFDFPANFQDTQTSFELKAHALKDALLVVDDFKPSTNPKEAARQDGLAHHIIRSVGDRHARGRATSDIKLRADRFPRGMVLATGESEPPGAESSAARCFLVNWKAGSVNPEVLTRAQRVNAKLYPFVMTAYVEWLAGQYDRLAVELPETVRREADGFAGAQGRVPESYAKLKAGADTFLTFALSVGAITSQQAEVLRHEAATALAACARLTFEAKQSRTPVQIFFELLTTLIAQGDVYLADAETEEAPADASQWGWRRTLEGGVEVLRTKPTAKLIGWLADGHVCLLPNAATAEVTQFARKMGETFPVNSKTLGEHFQHEGLLSRVSQGRATCTPRINGRSQRVWSFHFSTQNKKPSEGGHFRGFSGFSGFSNLQDIDLKESYTETADHLSNTLNGFSGFSNGQVKPLKPLETTSSASAVSLYPHQNKEVAVAETAETAETAKNIGGEFVLQHDNSFPQAVNSQTTEAPKRNRKVFSIQRG